MNNYGVNETNPITQEIKDISDAIDYSVGYTGWSDPDLAKIVRLRLLSDRGHPFWDVSYCYGQLKDGTFVNVALPFQNLPKRNMSGAIIDYAKEDGIFAKSLGVFDAISTLN